MSVLMIFLIYAITIAINSGILWAAAKITKNDTPYRTMFCISLICFLSHQLPLIGWIPGIIVLCILLVKWADMAFWPDTILTILVSELLITLLILPLSLKLFGNQ